jgi:hypothetical protein
MRTRAHVALPGPKRQGAGAVQDAGANGHGTREREAPWTAVAYTTFPPRRIVLTFFSEQNRLLFYGNALDLPQSPQMNG